MASQSGEKGTRSRQGCTTCRARKVRCDERLPKCVNCERLGLDCAGYENVENAQQMIKKRTSDPEATPPSVNLKRKRTFRSCFQCRSSKVRCSGNEPKCSRCHYRSLACEYEEHAQPIWMSKLADPSERSGREASNPNSLSPAEQRQYKSPEGIDNPEAGILSTESGNADIPLRENESSIIKVHAQDVGAMDYAWLFDDRLPKYDHILLLIESYFSNIHPLRCFAFIHKPIFLEQLDSQPKHLFNNNALLLVICALGAPFYLLALSKYANAPPARYRTAGALWAKRAQQIVLEDVDIISVAKLMAVILLHDHSLRQGKFANAFMLSGIAARMAQALQINLEHSTDVLCEDTEVPTVTDKESRRRVMWSVYTQDAIVGSGVGQLTLVDEKDIKVQLPCDDRSFVLQRPCITELLQPNKVLSFLPQHVIPQQPTDNMGMTAYYLRHMSTRKKVLAYIKRLGTAQLPWLPTSEFALLNAELQEWYLSLPANLQWTKSAFYIRREFSQVGALLALHLSYHQTIMDLYRIGAPALYKVRDSFTFPPSQQSFRSHLQSTQFSHAKKVAEIVAEAMNSTSHAHAIADSWLPTTMYESVRVMLYYLTQIVDPGEPSVRRLTRETLPLIQSSIRALRAMQSLFAVAEPLATAAQTMLMKTGIASDLPNREMGVSQDLDSVEGETGSRSDRLDKSNSIAEHPFTNNPEDVEPSLPGTPAQTAPDWVLNPLSIYRMARRTIPEKHAPETIISPTTSVKDQTSQQRRHSVDHSSGSFSQLDDRTTVEYNPSATEQASFEELQWLFTADPGWTWQQGDTAVNSLEASSGMPPWQSGVANDPHQPERIAESDWAALFPFAPQQ